MSGDDRIEDILGYSDDGQIDIDNMPDNLRYWLECYEEQIKLLDNGRLESPKAETRSGRTAIEPLIKTAWNQSSPYNLQCPVVDEKETSTGCVATALAQIMYYYQWPKSCPDLPEYSYIKNNGKTETIAKIGTTSFKWDKMKTKYLEDETGESADAVAELMRYCGQAVETQYSASKYGSSANSYLHANILIEKFGYSANLRNIVRSSYSTAKWEEIIYGELSKNRPVLYTGYSKASTHEFICDGYDGDGRFHINWGWGGSHDGWFLLSLTEPSAIGIGSGTENSGYCFNQSATLGLRPATDGEIVIPQIMSYSFESYPTSNFSRNIVNENFPDFIVSNY